MRRYSTYYDVTVMLYNLVEMRHDSHSNFLANGAFVIERFITYQWACDMGPLLLTWINFNLIIGK